MAFCDNNRGIISEAKPTRMAQSETFFRTIAQNMDTTFLSSLRSPSLSSITKRNNAMMSKPKTCWVKKLVSKKEKKANYHHQTFLYRKSFFSLHLASLLSTHMCTFCGINIFWRKKHLF